MVKREKFMLTDPLEGTNGTCWRYAARLISAAVAYPCLIIIAHSSLVRKRGDNDSFAARGVVHRLGIAICQWTRAIQQLSVPDVLKARMIKLAHSDISFLSMLFASQFTGSTEERQLYKKCVRQRFEDKKLSVRFARAVLLRTQQETHTSGPASRVFHEGEDDKRSRAREAACVTSDARALICFAVCAFP
jgi:hypothetical protein